MNSCSHVYYDKKFFENPKNEKYINNWSTKENVSGFLSFKEI